MEQYLTQSEQLVCHDKCPLFFRLIKKCLVRASCIIPEALHMSPAASCQQHSSSCRNVGGSFCGYGSKTAHIIPLLLPGYLPSCGVPLPNPGSHVRMARARTRTHTRLPSHLPFPLLSSVPCAELGAPPIFFSFYLCFSLYHRIL